MIECRWRFGVVTGGSLSEVMDFTLNEWLMGP